MADNQWRTVNSSGERFLMLALYSSLILMQSFQFLQYTIIANITQRFFDISTQQISLTSIVNFVALVFLTIPSNYLLFKIGVRNQMILGATLICLGTTVKWYGNEPDRFYQSLFGQCLVAISSPVLRPMARQVSRMWFPPDEVSRATSVVLLSIFAGNMLATVLPVYFVPDSKSDEEIEAGLDLMFTGQGVFAIILFILVVIFFKNEPNVDKNEIEMKSKESVQEVAAASVNETQVPFFESLSHVINKNIILIIIVGSIGCGVHLSFMTVFNEFLFDSFNRDDFLVGIAAFLYCAANVISTFFYGYILDKNKCYKALLYLTFVFSIVFLTLVYYGTETKNMILLFVAITLLGCTLSSFAPINFNFAADLTYPEPESVSSGLLIISSELTATVTTLGVSYLIDNSTRFVITTFYTTSLLFAIVFTCLIKTNLNVKTEESLPIKKNGANKDYTNSCH